MKTLWNSLSGKKTVISAILKAIADILTAMNYPEIANAVDVIGNTLLTIGLTHKGVKKINN